MKHINATEICGDHKAVFYVDVYGDIFDSQEEAELLGMAGTVTVEGFYVGTAEGMKRAALEKYNAGLAGVL